MLCESGRTPRFAIVAASSSDGGATWSAEGIVVNSFATPGRIEDKEFLAIDTYPENPFTGRMYTCWHRRGDHRFAFSVNGGAGWAEVDLPAAPDGDRDLLCDIAVEDDGTVHVAFNSRSCGPIFCDAERMFYTRSIDGGLNWLQPSVIQRFNLRIFSGNNCPDAQDLRCIHPFGTIAVDNSGGACDGRLYVAFTDFADGQDVNSSDVWVAHSTDSGAGWSPPVRVNDDGQASSAQFHPYMEVDPATGFVVVAWHDTRNHAANQAIDYYLARSTDCGATFEANEQISLPSPEFHNSARSSSNASVQNQI